MRNLRKYLALLLAFLLILTACGGQSTEKEKESKAESGEVAGKEESKEEETGEIKWDDNSLYLVTDLGTIDDKSFNQGSFEGLKKFADEVGVKANYLRPQGQGDQVYLQAIEQAVAQGAKVVVTPGFLFDTAVGAAQDKHPEVKFIAVDFEPQKQVEGEVNDDGSPKKETYFGSSHNTTSIMFREQESGFLAGYAAVKEGYKKLGFAGGMAVPAVVRYGFGYIAGADYAAKEMGIDKVDISYTYTGTFNPQPEIQTMAATWYKNGTEVIFSCGGGIAASVLKAAQENNGKMIGVDVDQKGMGEEVITSAMKNLQAGVYKACKDLQEGKFPGDQTLRLGASDGGAVQISDDFSRFKTFTEADYKAIYEKIANNVDGLADSIPDLNPALGFTEMGDPTLIMEPFTNINLNYIK